VRDNPHSLSRALARLANSRDDFYRVRDSLPKTSVGRAARFIYLTNLSFNGIYRVNRLGQFNVPYGQRPHLQPLRTEHLREATRALAGTSIATADFGHALAQAGPNDLVYLDPPYTVVHGSNGFLRYNERVFSWQDQTRLASMVRELHRRGCHIILTNADHASIRALYTTLQSHTIARYSCMSASSKYRRRVTELVLTNLERRHP
jgi:DNA adenine methylase